MLVPHARMAEAAQVAKTVAEKLKVGDPRSADTTTGPVVNKIQWEKIQGLIKAGIDEGAKLDAGGLGRPEGLNKGYYVRPTVFSNVKNDMTIGREEIFGPVLSIIGFKDEDEAVQIANDTVYGLAGYVSSGDVERRAPRSASHPRRQRQPQRSANERAAPFGGYKQSATAASGPLRPREYLEVKAIAGWARKRPADLDKRYRAAVHPTAALFVSGLGEA